MSKTIELDCAPGSPRPGDLFPVVVRGTVLEKFLPREPVSKFFGCWLWDFSKDVTDAEWTLLQPIVKERIVALYETNQIRYGSW